MIGMQGDSRGGEKSARAKKLSNLFFNILKKTFRITGVNTQPHQASILYI